MNKKVKITLISSIITDLLLAIVLLFVQRFHVCHDDNCLICALVAIGFAFVGAVALIIVLFPFVYSLKIKLFGFKFEEKRTETKTEFKHFVYANNFSLVNSFVKIQ